jgi:hypothetical protein
MEKLQVYGNLATKTYYNNSFDINDLVNKVHYSDALSFFKKVFVIV